MAEVTLKLGGLTCQHCVSTVKQAIEGLEGVQSAEVEIESARVNFDDSAVSRDQIEDAVIKAGYKVTG